MDEILRNLRSEARVLDLGSRTGSFPSEGYPGLFTVRLDREFPAYPCGAGFVQADASRVPFRDGSFDAVIANHSLEHMDQLASVLQEIGRVVRSDGSVYVAVPDGSSLTDRLYRWVYHGGGHVNFFRSAGQISQFISDATGLRLVAMRVLHSSLGFLARRHFLPRPPRRLWLFGNGNQKLIAALNYVLRVLDRLLRTRMSVYGWAFYFGDVREAIATIPWTNVCVNCGAGHSAASLAVNGLVRRSFFAPRSYNCPNCGGWNLFTEDVGG
ncbi:MAG: class I SAM-dependent methyltransferase [Bryobacteraceae bacterium]